MRISDFLPDIANRDSKLVQANEFLNKIYDNGFANFAKSYKGMESQAQPLGIEQLYWEWLRTAYAYRRMFLQDLYLLAFDSAEVRTPFLHLRNQVFKKGFDDWKPNFKFKCANPECGKEFQERIDECDKCHSTKFKIPDEDQYVDFDKFRTNANIFGNSLEEILKITLDDLNVADDAWILLNKQYKKADQLYGQVIEVRRIHPALVEFDLDKSGIPKNSHWICLFHRDVIHTEGGECNECKGNLIPVMYVYNHRGRRIYVPEGEMIHISKFSPSETYGYSMLLTIMQKVLTLSGMDRFLYRYFFERKAPTGMILTYTDDPQSLEAERARVEAKMMEDPTYMPWVAVSQRTGRGRTDFVRLFHTLQEMDYMPVRNEIRDRISAAYGVPQMYMNVMEGIGGISGQSQQLKVFNDVIQADQRMYNEKVFPILLKAFGITDWKLQLRPPEEKVEGEILQLATQKVNIASQMRMMGFDVELKPECKDISTLDFTFSGKAQPMTGPMGGMFGGEGGMMPAPSGGGQESEESQEGPAWNRKIPQEEKVFKPSEVSDEEESSDDFANQPFKVD